jgi:hypothetical protein
MMLFAEARLAASIINKSSIKLSELGNVDCTKNTCEPRIDSSNDTANSPSAKWVMFMLPNSQPKLWQIFSAKYLDFVPENTLKGDVVLILFY